jgi:hypothetical protein
MFVSGGIACSCLVAEFVRLVQLLETEHVCHVTLNMLETEHVSHVTFDGGRLARNILERCLQHVREVLATSLGHEGSAPQLFGSAPRMLRTNPRPKPKAYTRSPKPYTLSPKP